MYAKMADIYDEMYHFKDYRAESDYVKAQVLQRAPSARTLLETAAGTGRFLEFLSQDFVVEGLDLSEEMLSKGRKRLPQLPFHRGDMTDFRLGRQFDVVCCLFRSIAHCKTPERFRGAILAMANHVSPGGLLLVEPFFTPDTFWDDHLVLNEYKGEDMKLVWMYVGKRTGTEVELDIHCLVGTSAGVNHFTEVVELGLFSPDQYRDAFDAAGLELEYDPVGPSGIGLYVGRKPLA
jgi:SAM-dependent methyltransferase